MNNTVYTIGDLVHMPARRFGDVAPYISPQQFGRACLGRLARSQKRTPSTVRFEVDEAHYMAMVRVAYAIHRRRHLEKRIGGEE